MAKILILYVPAIHAGYIKLFQEQAADVYILDHSFVTELPRMDRDIRALTPDQVRSMLAASDLGLAVHVLTMIELKQLRGLGHEFVLPDEDVSHAFADRYLQAEHIKYVSIFLRWDKQISLSHQPITATTVERDKLGARIWPLAFTEAAKSPDWWRQVGAIVMDGEKVMLIGHNKPVVAADYTFDAFGDPRSNFDAGTYIELSKAIHAEAAVIAEAARRGIGLEGMHIYVTTFPCPNCAKLIAVAGIRRVYYQAGYSLLDAADIFKQYHVDVVRAV